MTSNEYWFEYLEANKLPKTTPYSGECGFGIGEEMSSSLISLVLSGQKKATTSSLYSFEIDKEEVPRAGNKYVVVNFDGSPCGVIETVRVTILPFKEIPWELAKKEGEDECMETWLEGHIRFFEEEAEIVGYEFTDDMPVVFEEFKLLYRE